MIKDGKCDNYTEVPAGIDDNVNIDMDMGDDSAGDDDDIPDDDLEYDNEYGDVVTVNNIPFVVCSGLVVPQDLLKNKIIPLINEEMERAGVSVDDIHQALLDDDQ